MKPQFLNLALIAFISTALLSSCTKDQMQDPDASKSSLNRNSSISNVAQTAASTQTTSAAVARYVDLKILDATVKNGRLNYTVTNAGNATSAPCKARIVFRCGNSTQTVISNIPAIAGAGTVVTRIHLSTPLPTNTVNGDNYYTVTVDCYNNVTELIETNNSKSGSWLVIY